MAKQNSLLSFTGKLGNIIGYYRNGKYFLRSMPEHVRQNTATRRAAYRFGIASKKAALIRHAVYNELDIHCDSSHINRLNKTLITAAGSNINCIEGFRFNQHTSAAQFFTIPPTLTPDGRLHIPPQTLPATRGISMLEVKVIATRIHFATQRVIETDTAMVMMNAREAFPGAMLAVNAPGKGTLVFTLQVRALSEDKTSASRKHFAADIIGVIAPQAQQVLYKPSSPRTATPDCPSGLLPYTDFVPQPAPVIQKE
jgi:hypothetical protein